MVALQIVRRLRATCKYNNASVEAHANRVFFDEGTCSLNSSAFSVLFELAQTIGWEAAPELYCMAQLVPNAVVLIINNKLPLRSAFVLR